MSGYTSIPLAAGQGVRQFTWKDLLGDASAAQQVMANQEAFRTRNALRDILGRPENLDQKTGMPTANAINKIMAVDPNAGMAIRANQLKTLREETDLAFAKSRNVGEILKQGMDYSSAALNAYDDAVASGMSPEQAQQRAQKIFAEGRDTLVKSGIVSPDMVPGLAADFDPNRARAFQLTYKDKLQLQEKQRQDQREDARLGMDEERLGLEERRLSQDTKGTWQPMLDPANTDARGNPTPYFYNNRTMQARTPGGQPYAPGGAQKMGSGANTQPNPLTPDAADLAARTYLSTGQVPGGFGGTAMRSQILNRAGDIAKEDGHTVSDYLEGRATYKADSSSLTAVTKQKNAAQGYERGASKEFDLAVSLLPKTPEPLNSQLLTRWVRSGATQFGDIQVPQYQAALVSALNEYAKVISGATGAAGATEGAREEALKLIPAGATSEQVPAIVDTLKKGMQLKINGYDDQISQIRGQIRTPGGAAASGKGERQELPRARVDEGGSAPQPASSDISYLRAHPDLAQRFDARFGAGTAAKILGGGEEAPAVPKALLGEKDGTRFRGSDGKIYVKRGNQMVPEGGGGG